MPVPMTFGEQTPAELFTNSVDERFRDGLRLGGGVITELPDTGQTMWLRTREGLACNTPGFAESAQLVPAGATFILMRLFTEDPRRPYTGHTALCLNDANVGAHYSSHREVDFLVADDELCYNMINTTTSGENRMPQLIDPSAIVSIRRPITDPRPVESIIDMIVRARIIKKISPKVS